MAKKERSLLVKNRSEGEYIRDQITLVNLYFQEVPFTKMAETLQERTGADYKLSYPTVKKHIDDAIQIWKEKQVIQIDERKQIELAKLDALENEYWNSWKRSLETKLQKSTKKEVPMVAIGSADGGAPVRAVLSREMIPTEETEKWIETDGNPKFLEGVERCIWKRATLLGLLSPLRVGSGGMLPGESEGEDYYDMPLEEVHKTLIGIFNVQINNFNGNNDKTKKG